jgi:hypothetical protein
VGNVGRDPFGEPVRAPLSPVELVHLLAEINADDGSTDTFKGVYSAEKAAALKAASFDRAALGARGLAYERLDQLTTEGAAYGAAVLAATGAGAFPDVASACAAIIQTTGSTTPGPASAAYQKMYPLYRELYPALRPNFNAIARIVHRFLTS